MPRLPVLTILILDGAKNAHATGDNIIKGVVTKIVSVHTLDSLADAAKRNEPYIAIFGADHPPRGEGHG